MNPLGSISWSHIRTLLPIKDENKRNYYINLCIKEQLSKRELITRIKNTSIETPYNIRENIKKPIIITIENNNKDLNEKYLKKEITARLKNIFEELGSGYAFIGLEYKIKIENITRYIDLLMFNVELNSYIVIEVKTRELKEKDKGQILMYMNLVDKTLKRSFHNKTIGIIISKYQNKFIATYVSEENIIPITYELK